MTKRPEVRKTMVMAEEFTSTSNVAARAIEQRGSKRPVFLECIQKDGTRTAVAYSYLTEIRFNPNIPNIIMFFSNVEIEVGGRNLLDIYEEVRTCRLTKIEEKNLADEPENEDTAFVDRLIVRNTK